MSRLLVLLSLFALLPACEQRSTFEDEGAACLVGSEAPSEDGSSTETSYEEGEPVAVLVTLEECAAGCAEDIEASCEVELAGSTLRISASGSYVVPGGSVACAAVCTAVTAQCESPPLAAGDYTVEYAGQTATLTVPETREPVAVSDGTTAVCDSEFF